MTIPTTLFSQLTVVELASVLAGPAVGMFFSELGARVIKVENARTGGDVTRRWHTPGQDATLSDSPYYHSINYGKEVHLLDLTTASAREQVYAWVAEADIVVSNFRPEAAGKLGMDYAALRHHRANLIYAELSGYGPTDDRPAFDIVLQAETGFLHMTGHAGQAPARMPVALIDLLAAHQLKEGILAALWNRERTGAGACLHVSLYDAAVSSLANQAANWLMAGHAPERMGSQHPNIAPYGDLLRCADGQEVVLAVGSDQQFKDLCEVLALPKLADDARFATNAARVANRAALLQPLQEAVTAYDRPTLLRLLQSKVIPAGAILALPDVFAQPAARSLLLRQTLPDGRETVVVRTVVWQWETTASAAKK